MAILTSFRLPGDPQDLLAIRSDPTGTPDRQVAVESGNLAHVIVDEGDGLRFFDLWETEDDMRRAAANVHRMAQTQGLPTQQEWRQWDVLCHQIVATTAGPIPTKHERSKS